MTTDNDSTFYEPYQAALEEDWDYLKKFFNKDNALPLSSPITSAMDTIFHLAVFSNSKKPLEYLLGIAKENPMKAYDYLAKNDYGDAALHEAAANGNLEAVKLLVEHDKELSNDYESTEFLEDINVTEFLEDINEEGETLLFKAAAYGKTEVVSYLASKEFKQLNEKIKYIREAGQKKEVKYSMLKDIHRQIITRTKTNAKTDTSKQPIPTQEEETIEVHGASILHVAIRGENFGLATLKDENGWTSLHLLATMPSAFKSGYRMGAWISRVFYFCLPVDDSVDDEKGSCFNLFKGLHFGDDVDDKELCCLNLFKGWWILGKNWSPARKNCEAKRKHKLAVRLEISSPDADEQGNIRATASIEEDSKPSLLFMATERGAIKIVKEILKVGPPFFVYKNHLKQNILHVAIKHRQRKIFDLVKRRMIHMTRLVRGIDEDGYTILHHAANTRDGTREIHPARPVYELQEKLKWYKRVKKMTPPHYLMLPASKDKNTCEELFDIKHRELQERAQQWIKETAQSCSTVAVLVATVVFAAAYTVPGGSNDKGYPVFLNNSFFLIFIVMDIVTLACSLTSVVTFLSILTSPFNYDEFLHTLPQKLSIGFSLLFFALTTTMLAFATTLLLIVRFQKQRWTTTIIYTAAFLPISIFALTQFPTYVAFKVTLFKFYKWIKKDLPCKRLKKRLVTKFQCYKNKLSMNDVLSKKNDDQGARPPV